MQRLVPNTDRTGGALGEYTAQRLVGVGRADRDRHDLACADPLGKEQRLLDRRVVPFVQGVLEIFVRDGARTIGDGEIRAQLADSLDGYKHPGPVFRRHRIGRQCRGADRGRAPRDIGRRGHGRLRGRGGQSRGPGRRSDIKSRRGGRPAGELGQHPLGHGAREPIRHRVGDARRGDLGDAIDERGKLLEVEALQIDRLGHELRKIPDDEVFLVATGLARVFEHGHVLRAANDERIEITQGRRLVHPVLGRLLLADRIGHPDSPAASAAAERIIAGARHLDELAADQLEHPTRLVVIAVEPPEMARVMERDPRTERLDDLETAAFEQLRQHARIVANRRDLAEVRVLVANRIVGVRIRGHDGGELPCRRHLREIVLDECLEETFLADPAHVVARRPLTVVEQSVIESGGAEETCHGSRDPLVAGVVGGIIAHEPEMLGGLRADVLDGELELVGPVAAGARAFAETVAAVRDGIQGVAQLLLHRAFFDQMATHLHDHRRVLDPDRADLHACAAGAAGPERLRLDYLADESRSRPARAHCGARRMSAQIENQVARTERRTGVGGRADFVATAALGTRIEIEEIFPGELVDSPDPDPDPDRGLGLGLLAGTFTRLWKAAQGLPVAAGERTENRDQVLGLGPGDRGDEGERGDPVNPPVGSPDRGRRRIVHSEAEHDLGEGPADRRPRPPRRLILRKAYAFLQETGQPDQEQGPEEQGILDPPGAPARPQGGLAAIVPPIGELRGPRMPAAPHHVGDPGDEPEAGKIGDEAEDEIERAVPEREAE